MKKLLRKVLPHMLLILVVATLASVLDGLISIFMMNSIDAVMEGNRVAFKEDVVKLIIIALTLLPFSLFLSYSKGIFKRRAVTNTKVDYISRVFKKNINEFQRDNNSKYVSALTNDIITIEANFIEGVYEVIVSIVNFIVAFLVIGYISPVALGAGIGIGILSTIISTLLSKPLQKHHSKRSELYESYTSYIKEVLSAFHIIKSNNLTEKVQDDFYKKSHAIQEKGYVIDKISTYITSLQNLNMSLTFMGIVGISTYMAITGSLTLGGVILIVNNVEKLMMPLIQLGEWMPKIFSTKSLFIKIDESLKNQDNYEETLEIDGFKDAIEFNNVSFSYEDTEVLKEISLTLKKGEKYLIVGPSGGGKSTLLKLLRKYFAPQGGTIQLDGINLKDVKKESYFTFIANVEQQVFLFEDTVRNNITLYKDYTETEINLAIDRAGLRDYVDGLANGLDSIIYDNGKNVSGGEKSRIAIARGLLAKSDIIFLDEAFASLDSAIAKEIEKTILNFEGVMVVNVSHVVFEETKKHYHDVMVVKNKGVYSL
ncbi:ABC transporter ATP-binding protein [Alkaliphilus serpentinus]|uniref:ABC transporter ATP-binding protein n=1 Tax=Alkaliphilus serpentinus TaxID=1482731 RepID=A0A833HQA4_9FIRM|nr:ABC transporter ATP-binding protein [Alkaliphilus serpentinus]KAB3531568.1 ABC transporter ATP-binding protein [Alkaliphilus serpentinus]